MAVGNISYIFSRKHCIVDSTSFLVKTHVMGVRIITLCMKVNERGLFCGSQDTDKRAREAILCLEKQRKEKQFLPVSEF